MLRTIGFSGCYRRALCNLALGNPLPIPRQLSVAEHEPFNGFLNTTERIVPISNSKSRNERPKLSSEKLSSILGIPTHIAFSLLKRCPTLAKTKEKTIKSSFDVLKELGLPENTISKCPSILKMGQGTLRELILFYRETGISFKNNPERLFRFQEYKYLSVKDLKEQEVIPPSVNVLENYFRAGRLSAAARAELLDRLSEEAESIPLWMLKHIVLLHYLKSELTVSAPAFTKERLKRADRGSRLSRKSFQSIRRTVRILMQDLKYTPDRHTVVLQALVGDMKNLERLAKFVKTNLPHGEVIRTAVLGCPRLLLNSFDNVENVCKVLDQRGLLQDIVSFPTASAQLLTLKPETIAERLEEIEQEPDLLVLRSNNRFMELISRLKKVSERLEYAEAIQSSVPSLHLLVQPENRFRVSAEANFRNRGIDLINYLHDVFPFKSIVEIKQQLQIHPYWKHVPLRVTSETLKYFKILCDQSFSIVSQHLVVVLYAKEKIEAALEALCLSSSKEVLTQFLATEPYALQLIIYQIEKPHYFSGHGVLLESDKEAPASAAYKEIGMDGEIHDLDENELEEVEERIDRFLGDKTSKDQGVES